jgi:hypothetical protein
MNTRLGLLAADAADGMAKASKLNAARIAVFMRFSSSV